MSGKSENIIELKHISKVYSDNGFKAELLAVGQRLFAALKAPIRQLPAEALQIVFIPLLM